MKRVIALILLALMPLQSCAYHKVNGVWVNRKTGENYVDKHAAASGTANKQTPPQGSAAGINKQPSANQAPKAVAGVKPQTNAPNKVGTEAQANALNKKDCCLTETALRRAVFAGNFFNSLLWFGVGGVIALIASGN